ncbi:unnamed protein product [Malus baccata var. baccata]
MIVAESAHVSSENNLAPEALSMGRLANGAAEKSLHKPNNQAQCQGSNGRCGSSGSHGTKSRPRREENCGEGDVGVSGKDAPTDVLSKKAAEQMEMTLEDMYNQDLDDEDDDSDWDPFQQHVEVMKWFCTNCTMPNLGDIDHCDVCREHRESGILRQGCFASAFDSSPTETMSDTRERHKGSQDSASKSSTAVGFDERMLLHSEVQMNSHPHPERPDRIRAIAASLATAGIFPGRCHPIPAREITREELQMVHSLEHIESVDHTGHMFSSYFTPDTYANEHSARAARLAAGLCADLAKAIVSGRAKNGFALVRPPGHHAGVRQAMGFCLHNNAAVAALAGQVSGAKKVLIIDWDVHHGNGTQEIFDQNKSVLYISLHRHEGGKFYPGTGAADEVGTMGAEGYCVNVPWSRGGVGDNDYIYAFQHVVLPIASEFAPDFTIISAGFDAARGDPLGCCDVTPAGYEKMTHMLSDLSGGKMLVILEGGYNLRSISSSATAVIKVLLGESPGCELDTTLPSRSGLQTVLEVLQIQNKYWPALGSSLTKLQSQMKTYSVQNKKKQIKKSRRTLAPLFWKWGRKALLYHLLNGHFHVNRKDW